MELIDVMQYEKDLKKHRLGRMIKNRSAIFAIIAGTAQVPGLILGEHDFLRAFNGFVIGLEAAQLIRLWKKEGLFEDQKIMEMLMTTSSYSELANEYQKFICDVASLVKGVGLKSAKETVYYLHALMEAGYFSRGMNHQYKLFEHEREYLPEICGAKVVTGTSVCRHMSSFVVDVMNEIGYTAAVVSCGVESDNPVKAIRRHNVKIDHAVAGIVDDGQHFLFDSTNGCFLALPWDLDLSDIESILVAQYVAPEKKRYLIVNPRAGLLNLKRDNEFKAISTSPLMKISVGEVQYIRDKIEKVLSGNMFNQFMFNQTHISSMKNIVELYQEVSPYSDEPIKKHLVRR